MAFLGMRGTGSFSADERPKNWREKILFLYPNGDMPLTAIMSKMGSESTDDPEFNWFTKGLAKQAGDVTNVYTDSAMSSAYTTGGIAGDTLYMKVAADVASEFRAGHQILLRNKEDYRDDCNAKVLAVTQNGANSKIAVKLLQADPTTTGIAGCDRALVVGSINAEGAGMPGAISYDPTKFYNLTQIFRTPLSITRTARKTKLRTGDKYLESKREALELHGIEMERAILFGIRSENIGDNGQPERTTDGIIQVVKEHGHTSDFSLTADYDGKAWLDEGENWLDEQLELIFRYGANDRLAVVGSGTVLAINKLIKHRANYEITSSTMDYGIKVKTWKTPFGDIHMKIHPLFSYEPSNRNSMLIMDPADLKWRFIDDTTFYGEKDQQNTGRNRIDGTDEEFLTEGGLEFHHPIKCGWLNGFGQDNPV